MDDAVGGRDVCGDDLFCMLYLISSIALMPGLILLAGMVHGRGFWITFVAISVLVIGTLGNSRCGQCHNGLTGAR